MEIVRSKAKVASGYKEAQSQAIHLSSEQMKKEGNKRLFII